MWLHGVLALAMVTADGPTPEKREPASDGYCYTRAATFQVPYALENPPDAAALLKPALYYSADGGAHWKLGAIDVDGASPVTFHAPGEGAYWLRMGLRRLGQTDAPDLGRAPEGALRVMVDRQPPTVRLVPRIADDAEKGPAVRVAVAVEDEPTDLPDLSIEVELPATETEPATRHVWIDRAVPGREYEWVLDPRRAEPVAFCAVAHDRAGNVGRDRLELAMLARRRGFERLARPEIVKPRTLRAAVLPGAEGKALTAAVDYSLDGPPLADGEVVELWCTPDSGRTWEPNCRHEDRSKPLLFKAPRPGLYGLRLVIRRGDAVVGDPPTAGTRPQVYVVMERAPDEARIASVEPTTTTRLEQPAGTNTPTDLTGVVRPAPHTAEPAPPVAPRPVVDKAALAKAAYEKGNYARLLKNWPEAARWFREALRHDPDRFAAQNDLAGVLHEMGLFKESIDAYYRAIDLEPRNADARFSLARTLIRANRFDDALEQLAVVTEVNPKDGEAWLYRGELLLSRRQDLPNARLCWRKAIDLAPKSAPWRRLALRRVVEFPDRH